MPQLESFLRVKKENRTVRWYAMSAVYRSELKIKAYLLDHKVECYVPMTEKEVMRKGVGKEVRKVPAVSNLIFVHSSVDIIQELKQSQPYLQYKISRKHGELYGKKIWVKDDEMLNFKAFCDLPVKKRIEDESEIKLPLLKAGQKVRLIKKDGQVIEGELIQFRGKRHKEFCVQAGQYKAIAKLNELSEFKIVDSEVAIENTTE